jgi:hypothetical protein
VSVSQRHFRDDGPLIGALPMARLPSSIAVGSIIAGLAAPLIGLLWPQALPLVIGLGVVAGILTMGFEEAEGLAWLVPPSLRILEYGSILAIGWAAGVPALAFVLMWAVSYHHYDTVYRARAHGRLPPTWVNALLGGWEGRILLIGAAFYFGGADVILSALAVWCAAVGVGESVAFWRSVGISERVEEL